VTPPISATQAPSSQVTRRPSRRRISSYCAVKSTFIDAMPSREPVMWQVAHGPSAVSGTRPRTQ